MKTKWDCVYGHIVSDIHAITTNVLNIYSYHPVSVLHNTYCLYLNIVLEAPNLTLFQVHCIPSSTWSLCSSTPTFIPPSNFHDLSYHKEWPTLFSVPQMLFPLPFVFLTLHFSALSSCVTLQTSLPDYVQPNGIRLPLAMHQVPLLHWHGQSYTFY